MTRTVKEYDERYTEFLDVAQRLFYTQGYEPTSVQTIIAEMGVAKGTFYHYFDSKVALLDALVQRAMTETITSVELLVADPDTDAISKFAEMFAHINRWKVANKDMLLSLMEWFYRDENVLLRTKMQSEAMALIAPLFATIIRQGVAEGVFNIVSPEAVGEIVLLLVQNLGFAVADELRSGATGAEGMATVERKVLAYQHSIERVLGAAPDTLPLIDIATLRQWFD